jgi:hypothetical protein
MSLEASSEISPDGGLSPFSIRSSPTSNIEDIKPIDDIIDELIAKGVIEDSNIKYSPDNEVLTYSSAGNRYFVKVGKTAEKKRLITHENDIYDIIESFTEEEQSYFIKRIRANSGDEQGYAYCILEYIDGISLYDYIASIQSKRINPSKKELYTLLFNITKALDILLQHGILHGDLKAQNIMVLPNSRVKLFDFELSTEIDSYSTLGKNIYATHENPSHGYLYICKVLGEGIYNSIESICKPSQFTRNTYAECLAILHQVLLRGGRKTRRGRGTSNRNGGTKRKPVKKVRWSRKNVSSRFGKGA